MYINFNNEKFNELIDDIKQTCQSKNISFPSILNQDISDKYIFPDDEGEELKQFLGYFSEFKSIVKFILDKEQEEVVTYDNHKFLSVEAGPGSGKTRVLVEKVKYMVNELGVKPESILIITFTEKAAGEFQERLIESGLLKSDVQKMQISTIYSFCMKILEENDVVGYDIFDDGYGEKVNMFVGQHLTDLGFCREYSIPDSLIPVIIRKYDEFATFNVDIEGLIEYIKKEKPIDPKYFDFVNSFLKTHDGKWLFKELNRNKNRRYKKSWYNAINLQIARSYPIYLQLLEKYHAIDFGQMQIKALSLLEYDNNLKYINVLIDEFQETTPIQMKIFERIIDNIKSHDDEKTSFTVVGDNDQRIYGFIGSFNYFGNLYDNGDFKIMYLPTNYRSTNQIIEISDDFIKPQRVVYSLKPKYGRKLNNNVYYMINDNKKTEARNIFEIIRYLKKEGKINNYSDIGILSRSVFGHQFQDLLNLFDVHNSENPNDKIPYKIRGLRNLIQKDEIKSILTLMFHLIYDDNPDNFHMNKWTSDWLNLKAYTGANFNQVLFDLSDDTKKILNNLQEEFENEVKIIEKEILEATGEYSSISTFSGVFRRDEKILKEIFSKIEIPFLSDENLIKFGVKNNNDLEFFRKLNELRYNVCSNEIEFFNRLTVSEVYFELLTTITEYLNEDNMKLHEKEVCNLSIIASMISNFEEIRSEHDFRGLYHFIYRTIENHDAYSPQDDAVQIMSVHKSKGLEFPVVIIASLMDKKFPSDYGRWFNPINRLFYTPIQYLKYKPDDIWLDNQIHYEEEQRIIYVAMSRAEDTLILSSIVNDCEESVKNALERLDDLEYIKSIKKGPECVQRAIDANLDKGCLLIDPDDIKIDTVQRDAKPTKRTIVDLDVTSFGNYQSCPFKYKLSNMLNFNKSQQVAVNDSNFIIDALNAINKRIKNNDNIYIGDDEVINTVHYVILNKYRDLFRVMGTEKLNEIIEDVLYYYNNFGKNIKIIDTQYSFHFKDKHYILNGIIDLIGERNGQLILLDYEDIPLDGIDNKLKQMHSYVLAIRDQNYEYFGKKVHEIEIYSIKSKEVFTFKVDEKIIENLQKELNDVALSIKKGKFDSKISDGCKYCQYSEICNQKIDKSLII